MDFWLRFMVVGMMFVFIKELHLHNGSVSFFPFFFSPYCFYLTTTFHFLQDFNHLLSYSHTVFCIWMQLLTLELQGCWFESWLAFYLNNIVFKVFFDKIVLFDERRFTRKKIYLWLAKAGETSCADSLCGFPLDINKIPHYFSSKTIRVL